MTALSGTVVHVEVLVHASRLYADLGVDDTVTFGGDDARLVLRAELAALVGQHVALVSGQPHITYRAGRESVLGMTAALFAVEPAATVLVDGPDEITQLYVRAAKRAAPHPFARSAS